MAKKTPSKKQEPALSYEQAIEKLESIITDIEAGEIGLEQSIDAAEQGTKLIQHCRQILDRAEKKIEALKVGDDGQIE